MADLQQYVNVDPAMPDQRRELDVKRVGPIVTLEAKVSPKKAGIPVFFELKAVVAKNIVPSLEEANFSADKLKHLKGRAGGLPGSSTRCARTDATGVARLKIKLSQFGGDEFEVEAYLKDKSGKKKKTLKTEKYVVWRRVYYQVSRFKDGVKGRGRTGVLPEAPKLNWASVEAEFKDRLHDIELIDETTKDLITRRANVMNADIDLQKSAREGYDPKREPLTMRVVMAHQLADSREDWLADLVDVEEGVPVTVTVRYELWVDESMAVNDDWLVEAEWRWDDKDGWKTLDSKYLTLKSLTTFEVNFSHIPKKHFLHFFRNAQLQFKVRYLKGSTNGLSWYNSIWIASENMHHGPRAEGLKQSTTIHETGHFIGMVAAGQSTHYTGKGHQGPHCNTGLSAADKAAVSYSGMSGTCVMFGESATSRLPKFCSVCDPSVRTRQVVLTKMPASW